MDLIPNDFAEHQAAGFLHFLNTFKPADEQLTTQPQPTASGSAAPVPDQELPYYHRYLNTEMRENQLTTMKVEFEHLREHDGELADKLLHHFYYLEPYLCTAVFNFVKGVEPEYVKQESGDDKQFWVALTHLPQHNKLRELNAHQVGQLVTFSGTVTRTSEVRPELYLASYKCLACGTANTGVEQQFKYTQPTMCITPGCGNKTTWQLLKDESVFVDWQRVKVQENSDEIPGGSLPRTMDVILRHEAVESAKAGDKKLFTGCTIVVPDVAAMAPPGDKITVKPTPHTSNVEGISGLRSLGVRELTYKLMFIAYAVEGSDDSLGLTNIRADDDLTPDEVLAEYDKVSEHGRADLYRMQNDRNIFTNMAKSIAPAVFGHDHIKQAILLMLLGGVHKETHEGIRLRGDINVAIIGDPSVAKSQFLKYVANFLPRAVYTSGKSSTAAGLTASVVKETENNEYAIEAGALMLADNGICCIDEFDKMDIKDQVAIHEAMEQQTISIAKAGIQATLNARASILAAANPLFGRYDKSKPLRANIAMQPSILSRFDLLHVMLDDTNEFDDEAIAQHIVRLHRFGGGAYSVPYSMEQLQKYIRFARSIKPELTKEAGKRLVAAYKELRGEDAAPGTKTAYRITVRQLEALVRLSEATARAYCEQFIQPQHVNEAKKLLKTSILKIGDGSVEIDDLEEEVPELAPEITGGEAPGAAAAGAAAGATAADGDDDDPMDEDNTENEPSAANVPRTRAQAHGSQGKEKPQAKISSTPARVESQPETAPPAAETQEGSSGKTKVPAHKYEYVKNVLLRRLVHENDLYEATLPLEGQEPAAAGTTGTEDDAAGTAPMDADEDATAPRRATGGAMTQEALLAHYLTHETTRGAITDNAAVEQEFKLAAKVITHLIRKEGLVTITWEPEQDMDEADAAYIKRKLHERHLKISPSYCPE